MTWRHFRRYLALTALLLLALIPAAPATSGGPTYALLILEQTPDSEARTLHRLDVDPATDTIQASTVLPAAESLRLVEQRRDILIFEDADGTRRYIQASTGVPQPDAPPAPALPVQYWEEIIRQAETPLSGPRQFVPVPGNPGAALFVMTGPQDTFANLYLITPDKAITQLSQSETLIPAEEEALSASADFIAWRPEHPGQFLYRARAVAADGTDYNALYLYDLNTGQAQSAPYFGKDPVWSPDGLTLAGARLNADDPPLYILHQVDVATGQAEIIGPGCNPQWSPDGRWLAFDGHTDSQWQSYTDCFASGAVWLWEATSGQTLLVTDGIPGPAHLIRWLAE